MTATDPGADTATLITEALVMSRNWQEFAAALLPVVDRIARTRAADELDAAADELLKGAVVSPAWLHCKWLTDRAAALRAEP